jgi:hypothetical protein
MVVDWIFFVKVLEFKNLYDDTIIASIGNIYNPDAPLLQQQHIHAMLKLEPNIRPIAHSVIRNPVLFEMEKRVIHMRNLDRLLIIFVEYKHIGQSCLKIIVARSYYVEWF